MLLTTASTTASAYASSNQVANNRDFQTNVEFTTQVTSQQTNVSTNGTNNTNPKKQLLVSKNTTTWQASIDYTDAADGYVMVQCTTNSGKALKVSVEKTDGLRYMYDLTPSQWAVLPFSEGSGTYKVTIYQNKVDNIYRELLSQKIDVALSNDLNPFLSTNQYVNYANAETVIQKASELTKDCQTDAEKIAAIYNYVISNMTYDHEKAENVSSHYIPDLEEILESSTGICFDYASLIVGMLRSQNIPAKMVFGYSGKEYHAWISVYVEEEIQSLCGMTYYDADHWLHMDPTFASGGKNSWAILKYINNSNNYTSKYYY